ncbi:MAG: diguanylate cyclase [candidate division Zixibacteria bacterium]
MRNTENTILESWPVAVPNEGTYKPTYHFALRQSEVNLDFHLEQYFKDQETNFHYFRTFDELVIICQRFPVDLIFLASRSNMNADIEILRSIKSNVFLSITPVIVVNPEPDDNDIVAVFENGAEEFIYGKWVDRLVEVRIRRVIERSRRDLAVNPSTKLPGPSLIEIEVNRQLEQKQRFAICYADLDNFKAYNDYYGYSSGDRVIKLTARIIKDAVFDLCRGGFVGHVAGDDFVFIIPDSLVEQICSNILETFDSLIPLSYDQKDRERGQITTVNRRGEVEDFPILTMSIAVLINKSGEFKHVGEMSKMLADLKKITKDKDGSNFMVERRSKY